MARNHVWRYTLRLFHTFAIFEKSRKIDAKREAKSHCERRALTAAPLGETGESRFDGLAVLETAKTANEPKSWAIWAQKSSKIH